jgi:hypothetical protein
MDDRLTTDACEFLAENPPLAESCGCAPSAATTVHGKLGFGLRPWPAGDANVTRSL